MQSAIIEMCLFRHQIYKADSKDTDIVLKLIQIEFQSEVLRFLSLYIEQYQERYLVLYKN